LAFNGKEPVGHPSVPEPFRSIGPIDGSFAPISDVPTFPESVSGGNKTGWLYTRGTDHFLNYTDENNRDLLPDEMHANWAANKIAELENQGINQSFFMGIGFVRPHTPLYAPKRFFDMFPLDEIELSLLKEGDAEDTHYKNIYPADIKGLRYYQTLKESYGGDAELGLKHFLQAYLACIAFVDEQIGIVVDAVNNSKFKDNTIIVLTSDHGWQMGEKEYLFKNSTWEESTRIPLIIRSPETKAGEKVDHPVSLIDLFPTLTDLCGLTGDNRKNELGGHIDGYSLAPFLKNPNAENWEGPNGALSMVGVGLNKEDVMKQTYSYRTKNWRYILYLDGTEELYDHQNDPYEWDNEADNPEYASIKKRLKKALKEQVPTLDFDIKPVKLLGSGPSPSRKKDTVSINDNKFKPGEIWYDNHGVHINAHGGGILFHNGIYYWFGEHKTEGKAGNQANVGIHCYSSRDLYHWNDEGICMQVSEDTTSLVVKGCIIERPKVIYNQKTMKFVMWFHHELKGQGYSAAMTGLAVADNVTGPYIYKNSLRPNSGYWPENFSEKQKLETTTMDHLEKWTEEWEEAVPDGLFIRRDFEGGQMARDMTLFVDDDGKAYHIHASERNLTLHISELSDDYQDFSGRYIRALPGGHNEAPSIFKYKGKYYMITSGCTGWSPNAARLLVADSVMGEWTYLGNPATGDNREITFDSQSTFIIPVQGRSDAFIFMADRWRPDNAIDGRYVWLPVLFNDINQPYLEWMDEWDISLLL